MQEKVSFYSVAATVVISVFGCSIHPKPLADNCPLKPAEIPTGYTRDECHCEPNIVQAEPPRDPEWERRMGRKPPGTTTESEASNGFQVTTEVHTTTIAPYTVQCSKVHLSKGIQPGNPITQLPKLCGFDGTLRQCGNDQG